MAQKEQQLKTNVDDQLSRRVDEYQSAHDMQYRADAVEELVEIGLREAESPLMFRLKGAVIKFSVQLVLVGIAVTAIGVTTPALAPALAGEISAVLILLAITGVAVAEIVRVLAGRNEVGAMLHKGIRR